MRNLVVLLALAAWTLTGWAQGDFTKTLSVDEIAAAGLAKLSPPELAQLKALVERYKAGEVTAVREAAQQALATAQREAAQKTGVAEARSAAVAAKPEAEASAAQPSWVRALLVLKRAEEKPDAQEAVQSRLVGVFTGWASRQNFQLENGQVWQVQSGQAPYGGIRLEAPAVRVYPGMLGAYWLQVEGVRHAVKVKPVKLE
jgi:biotin carboxyl carrier protein